MSVCAYTLERWNICRAFVDRKKRTEIQPGLEPGSSDFWSDALPSELYICHVGNTLLNFI